MKTILFTLLAFAGSLTAYAYDPDGTIESYSGARQAIDATRYVLEDELQTFRQNADNGSTFDV
jgi:hypothetical protein